MLSFLVGAFLFICAAPFVVLVALMILLVFVKAFVGK